MRWQGGNVGFVRGLVGICGECLSGAETVWRGVLQRAPRWKTESRTRGEQVQQLHCERKGCELELGFVCVIVGAQHSLTWIGRAADGGDDAAAARKLACC
jgi:hypothetical protein